MNKSAVSILCLMILLVFACAAEAKLLFTGDFEQGPIPLEMDNPDSPWYSNAYSCEVVQDHARTGDYALKAYVSYEGNHYRSEVIPKNMNLDLGKEYWFGVSIYLPADWNTEYKSKCDGGSLFQLHHNSWSGYPEMDLPLTVWHGYNYDADWRVTRAGEGGQGFVDLYAEPLDDSLGKWTDWVFDVRFSPGSDGFVKVWKDGVQVADSPGSNFAEGYPTKGPINFQMGLYMWGYRPSPSSCDNAVFSTTERTAYIDEFRVGDADSSYEEVAPPKEEQTCQCALPEICCDNACTSPACNSDKDCGADSCRSFTCESPGTCSASCISKGITSCKDNDGCCPADCSGDNDNDCIDPDYAAQDSEDALIEYHAPGNNYGAMDTFYIGSRNNGWGSRVLIKFPGLISSGSIPAGSTIESASLVLTSTGSQQVTSPIDLRIRRVLESWTEGNGDGTSASEGESTWNYRDYSTLGWQNPGCSNPQSSTTTNEASITFFANPAEGDQSTFDVTQIVQQWVTNGESSNNGFILIAPGQELSTQDYVRFASSESANPAYKPKLVVYYSPGTGSACNSDADADKDYSISIGELINYISRWKAGSVTIGNLIDAIGKWKSGC